MMRRAFVVCLLLGACGRTGSHQAHDGPRLEGPESGSGAANSGETGGSAGAPVMEPEPSGCEHPYPGTAPLSMLKHDELGASLQQLLGSAEQAERLPPEDPSGPAITARYVEVMHEIAHATALEVVANPERLADVLDCDPAKAPAACQAHFIERFVGQAFRRPVTAADRTELGSVFELGQKLGNSFDSGVRAVIEVTLQSPEFLYLVELGTGAATGDVVALTPFETASRLSFFLTGGPPDPELFQAAENDRLQADQGLEEQVERLLGSPANRDHVVAFYRQLYGLYNDGSADPPITSDVLELAQEESRRFIEDVTFGSGTFRALLTEPTTWVNEPLARFYGYPDVTGNGFRPVKLNAKQRGGLFTQEVFLDATSHGARTNPIARGTFIINQLLCQHVPNEPAGLGPVEPPDLGTFTTTREQFAAATADPRCSGCHNVLNPPGFAFEHYDSVGRYREQENGQAVDSSGTLSISDAAGSFQNATELLAHIAESKDGQTCFVSHWLEHAFRRRLELEDACLLTELSQSFADSGGNVPQLVLALAKSDQFKYRLSSELRP